MTSVRQIVGIHHRADMPLLHGDFKGGKIDLTHGALVNNGIRVVAVELGIISHEMFGRRAHSLALHSLDVSHRNLPSEIRIFAHVFEVAAIHRRAIDVEARPEHEVNSPGAGVSPYLDPFLLGKRGIPGGGQRNSACHYGRGWFGVAYPERTV